MKLHWLGFLDVHSAVSSIAVLFMSNQFGDLSEIDYGGKTLSCEGGEERWLSVVRAIPVIEGILYFGYCGLVPVDLQSEILCRRLLDYGCRYIFPAAPAGDQSWIVGPCMQ